MNTDSGPDESRGGSRWAHDLVETAPEQLRARRLRRIGIGVAAGLVVAGGATAVAVQLHDSRPEPVINNAGRFHDAPILSYVISAPAGTQPASRELHQDEAGRIMGQPQYLNRYKFTTGYERQWVQPDGATVSVRLLRFRGAKNAAYYARDMIDYLNGTDAVEDSPAVAGIPGARSIVNELDGGSVIVSLAASGDLVAVTAVTAEGSGPATNITQSVLADQFARI
ncbi:hypothetical protein [Actinoplanes sp. N902-109]|uniref:DUF7373 family lipoprotein n=1 Tax=Actinoplanes sp. (strain N902-109) TaxID=649831 RepID=UPI0012FC59AD|nr:hypothetical protein [Actinoplanes sp. N902-109]